MSPAHAEPPSRAIAYRHIIELSHTIHPLMPHRPGDAAATFAPVAVTALVP
jgi:hypothetical protein